MKNEQYEAADALEAIGFALSALRAHVCELQKAYRVEVMREAEAIERA